MLQLELEAQQVPHLEYLEEVVLVVTQFLKQ